MRSPLASGGLIDGGGSGKVGMNIAMRDEGGRILRCSKKMMRVFKTL